MGRSSRGGNLREVGLLSESGTKSGKRQDRNILICLSSCSLGSAGASHWTDPIGRQKVKVNFLKVQKGQRIDPVENVWEMERNFPLVSFIPRDRERLVLKSF